MKSTVFPIIFCFFLFGGDMWESNPPGTSSLSPTLVLKTRRHTSRLSAPKSLRPYTHCSSSCSIPVCSINPTICALFSSPAHHASPQPAEIILGTGINLPGTAAFYTLFPSPSHLPLYEMSRPVLILSVSSSTLSRFQIHLHFPWKLPFCRDPLHIFPHSFSDAVLSQEF